MTECQACSFWVQIKGDLGQCRVRAPVIIPTLLDDEPDFRDFHNATAFPVTSADDGCAEFGQREDA